MAIFDPFGGYSNNSAESPSGLSEKAFDPFGGYVTSSKKTKKQQEDEERKKKLDELIKAENAAPKDKSPIDNVADFLSGVAGFTKDNIIDPAVDFGGKTLNTLAYVPTAIAGEVTNDDRIRKIASDMGYGSLVSNDIATGKATPMEFARDIGQAGTEAATYVAPFGRAGVLASAGINAGLGTAQSTLDQLKETGRVDLGTVAANAAGSAIIGGAIPAFGKAVGKIKNGRQTAQETAQDVQAQKTTSSTSKDVSAPQSELKKLQAKSKKQALTPAEKERVKELKEQVGQAVKNRATPEGGTPVVPGIGQSRYASKTLKESDFVGLDDDKLGASYQKTTNAQRADTSLKALDDEGLENFSTRVYDTVRNTKKGKISDQDVFDAQAAAQALEEKGGKANLQKAADIYNELSEHLTEAGKTVQAASIMARRTPQGLSYYAQKQFQKHGVEMTPEKQKELKGLIDAVKAAPPKTEEAAIARDNVMYFIGQNIPSSAKDKVIGFWRAGLLTAPTTPLGAAVGNAAMAAQRKLITNPVSAFADLVQSAITKKRTTTLAKAGEFEKGAAKGLKNATSKQYAKTGFDPMTEASRSNKYDTPRHGINYGDGRLGRATGAYVNGVYKLVGGLDQPFRYGAERELLSSMAKAEVKNQKLKGDAAKKFYDDFMENPPREARERANKEALRETFQDETRLGNAAASLSKHLPVIGEVVIPFTRVPASVASRIIDHTPIGTARTLTKELYNAAKGKGYDQRAVSRAIGEGTLSVPILGAGYALAQNGDITGGYPATKAERDEWIREGKQPNSIRINGEWHSLNYIQPFGAIMSIGAGLNDAAKSGADVSTMVTQALASGGQSILGQSFLQGMQSALDAVQNPAEYAGRYIGNLSSSIVPNFIKSAVRASDPYQREVDGAMAGLMSTIPGQREKLPAKLDAEGNPIPAKNNFINQYINPLRPSRVRDDSEAQFYNDALAPASKLKSRRSTEIKDLLQRGRVQAAQRKIDEYNQQLSRVLSPYIQQYGDSITPEQMDKIDNLFLGEVFINSKGRPYISDRDDLPQ